MTYKTIESSREVRLWLTHIVFPLVATAGTFLYMRPDVRQKYKNLWYNNKDWVKSKFRRKDKN